MKTETKILAIAYDVELIDLRTHEHLSDRIVLEQSCLRELHKMDISDHEFISMSCAKKGYLLHKMNTRRKVSLTVDLEKLYARTENTANSQTFANLEGEEHGKQLLFS